MHGWIGAVISKMSADRRSAKLRWLELLTLLTCNRHTCGENALQVAACASRSWLLALTGFGRGVLGRIVSVVAAECRSYELSKPVLSFVSSESPAAAAKVNQATIEPSSDPAESTTSAVTVNPPYPSPAELPTQEGLKGLRFDFNGGCRVHLPESYWTILGQVVCRVVMISGFSHPTTEFETTYRVINYHKATFNSDGARERVSLAAEPA
jgi:hypothetical protein